MSKKDARARALQRSRLYQQQFNLPDDELLVDEFHCALQQKILLQGKLYISQNFACFHSNIFGQETTKILLASDITGVQLAKILMIPNSIKVFLTYETYFFASFLSREDAYKLLTKISRGESIAHMGIWAQIAAEEGSGTPSASANGRRSPGSDRSDEEDEEDDAPPPRRGGHGRSGSMDRSPGPRSPTTGNIVRHTSLLNDNAFKVKSAQERQRAEALRETQRQIKAAGIGANKGRDGEWARTDSEEEDDRDVTPPPKRNGKAASAAAATASGKKVPARKPSAADDRSSDDGQDESPPPRGAAKGAGRGRADSYGDRRYSDDESPPPQRRKGGATASAAAAAAPGKGKGKGGPSAAWLAAASNAGMPKDPLSVARRTRFYEYPPLPASGVDPAVAAVAAKFKNKKLGLDSPAALRRLLHQGPLKRQGGWSVVDRWCFLFSDQFLFAEYPPSPCTPDAVRYKEKQCVQLRHLVVDMRPTVFQGDALGAKVTKLPHAFRLLDNDPTKPPMQYVCATLTVEEKFDWGRRLGEAISKAHANAPQSSSLPAAPAAAAASASASSSSFSPAAPPIDRTAVGWYTQFVRGTLPYAVMQGAKDPDLLQALLRTPGVKEHINDLDQEGNGLLHLCVLNRTPQLLSTLLAAGADLHLRDWDNHTLAHLAVVRGEVESLRVILALKGADPSLWHPMGAGRGESKVLRESSALWMAAVHHYASNPPLADVLLRVLIGSTGAAAREFLDERSEKNQMTLLDYCAYNTGMRDVAETILQLGASVDLTNPEGLTTLSQAVRVGNVPMVSLLLSYGAQPNLRSHKHGLNFPLHYSGSPGGTGRGGGGGVESEDRMDCARELVARGARWSGDNSHAKNREGVRVRDLFPTPAAQAILKQAEERFAAAGVVENRTEGMKPPATSVGANNRHEFDSCCLCQLEFTLVNKREYCRRCGWNVCNPCSTKRMLFLAAAPSRGKSRNSAPSSSAPSKERVCDGCYNFTVYANKNAKKAAAAAAAAATPKRSAAAAGSDDEEDESMAPFRKPVRKAVSDDEEDEDAYDARGRGGAAGARRTEPSGFKSVKRLNVDSDEEDEDEDDESGRNGQGSDDEEDSRVARKSTTAAAAASRKQPARRPATSDDDDDAESPRSDSEEDEAPRGKQKGKAADPAPKQGLGSKFMSVFSSSKKKKKSTAAPAEPEKKQTPQKKSRAAYSDDEEEDDEVDERAAAAKRKDAARTGASASASAAAAAGANGRARPAAAALSPNALSPDSARTPGRPPGWSRREATAASSDSDATDSDDAGSGSDDDSDAAARKKKGGGAGNLFQRGFQTATGAVKTAGGAVGGAVGGAMSSVARGVTKLAISVQEKVTAVTVPVDEEDPVAAAKERRKEAARQRVRQRRIDNGEEDEEEEPPAAMARKTASTSAALGSAKKQAMRNQEMLDQMEHKGQEVEDGGREFQSLAARLKAKSKAGRL